MLGKMLAGKFFRITVSQNAMKSYFLFGFFDFVNVSLLTVCHHECLFSKENLLGLPPLIGV